MRSHDLRQGAPRPAAERERFTALDGCRGAFALTVALMHMHVANHFADLAFVRAGYLAVDFFFVLSGFVITHAARGKLGSPGELVGFVIRRFGRVWPLHVVVLVGLIGMETAKLLAQKLAGVPAQTPAFARGSQFDGLAIPAHLALVHSLNLFDRATWNVPSWSISTEFYTYLVFALGTLLLPRKQSWLSLFWVTLGGVFLAFHVRDMDTTYNYGFMRCLYGFFAGQLVYQLHTWLPNRRGGTLVELGCLGLVVAFMSSAVDTRWTLLAPLVFAGPILVFAGERGALSSALRRPGVQALGRWSYAVYIVHEPVFVLCHRTVSAVGRKLGVPLTVPQGMSSQGVPYEAIAFGNAWLMDLFTLALLGFVVLLAAGAHRWIELPAQRYFAGHARGFGAPSARPAAVGRPRDRVSSERISSERIVV